MVATGRRSRAGLALMAVVLFGVVAACGGRVGENGRFGVVYMDAQGFYAGVRVGMQQEAEVLGRSPQLLQLNAQGDASKESTFIDQVSAAKVDALILSPASATASVPALKLAHESGIPIICYNTCVAEESAREYVSAYVLGDPTRFGELLGERAAEYFLAEGNTEPEIAVVNCEFVEVCIERRKGFEQALHAELPGARIVANQEGATIDEAVDVAERILTANPDLDAFYGEAGGATMGAVRAVQARNKVGQTVVFGSDMSTEAGQALAAEDILKGVVDISGITVGELAARAADDVRRGEITDYTVVPAPVELYATPEDGSDWLRAHPDGVP
ncbi:sugar ABC transporter substrate-binding protein [Saccharomonospora piscinae]|uniref:Sugar ABC transporter substrate-binding protein n=1 Tax=Saccharomonospora piscinae TaxID=687388 RepID=A0A1V8ZYB1_SACPI|nr:substrate-binding domain-containing protein [Saccharomonospora piscinae]OQO89781.1 sugar ABC transporter substrate-binding protein [Saccharomonospora piscinae]TLW91378.1 sugar ABC transporter substrate-binding protein [Saccharomonospora piscinae]